MTGTGPETKSRLSSGAVEKVIVAAVATLLFASVVEAKFRGFKWEKVSERSFAVSYMPKTIFGEFSNMMLLLVGNTGQLCLDRGFSHARMESVALEERPDAINRVSSTVEFFGEPVEGAESCEEMARRPKDRKELKRYGGPRELPRYHTIRIEEEVDPFDGQIEMIGRGNRLTRSVDGTPVGDPIRFELNPLAVVEDGLAVRSFQVFYRGPDWMFIRDGESLVLKIDDELVRIPRAAENSKVLDGGDVLELAVYHVEPGTIEKMVAADDVLVRVSGKNFTLDRQLDEVDQQNLRYFLERLAPHLAEDAPVADDPADDPAGEAAETEAPEENG
jgi:hypothetical protein